MPTYQKIYITIYENGSKLNIENYDKIIYDKIYKIDYNIREKYNTLYEKYKDNTLKNNTSVYFSPFSVLPSYKFKSYINDNKLNIKTVRKTSKSDSIIINNEHIKEIYYKSNREYHVLPNTFLEKFKTHTNVKTKCDSVDYYIVEKTTDLINKIKTFFPFLYDEFMLYEVFNGYFIEDSWGDKKAFKNYDAFLNLINNFETENYDIIFDTSINNDINRGMDIDDDIFVNLLNMIMSNDLNNFSLAQEIIANCNLETSKPYILFLLWKFENLKKSKEHNQNFKYLLNEFKQCRYMFYNNIRFEDFISNIIKNNPEYTNVLFNCIKLYINHINKATIINEIKVS